LKFFTFHLHLLTCYYSASPELIYRVLFFNCSYPKISKYKKKTKYPNCSHPKISKYKKKNKVSELFPPKNVLSVERAMGGYFEGRRV